jgi:hypothetical protein
MITLNLQNLKQEDPEIIKSFEDILRDFLQEYDPDIDLRSGVVCDLLLRANAALGASINNVFDRALVNTNLTDIINNPDLADSSSVDKILSNWGIQRNNGSRSLGLVTIYVSRLAPFSIPATVAFSIGSEEYVTTYPISVRTSEANIQSDTDLFLQPANESMYFCNIPVISKGVGAATKVRAGSIFSTTVLIPGLIVAKAEQDFIGGEDVESTEALLARQGSGIVSKSFGNKLQTKAVLLDRFPDIQEVSVVKYFDAEMTRTTPDSNLLGIRSAGFVDLYVRTNKEVISRNFFLDAKCTWNTGGTLKWRMTVGKDVFPGFYKIDWIKAESQGPALDLIQETVIHDPDHVFPAIISSSDCKHSAYQVIEIDFEDRNPKVFASVGQNKGFFVALTGLPRIDEIQKYTIGADNGALGLDILVKAPYPVFLTISIQLKGKSLTQDLQLLIKETLSNFINTQYTFKSVVYANHISSAIGSLLDGRQCAVVDFSAKVLTRGDDVYLYSRDNIDISTLNLPYLTDKNTCFFIKPSDIMLSSI